MTQTNIKIYLFIIAFLFATTTLAASPIRPFEATYIVKYHGISAAKGKRSFKLDKTGHYQFINETRSTVPFTSIKIIESSYGQWTPEGPKPDEYVYQQFGLPKKREVISRFNWKTHQNDTQKNDEHYQTKITEKTHDRISYQLALRQDLIQGKKEFAYHLADKNRVKTYIFKQMAKETLKTPAGKIETIRMKRTNSKPKNGTVIFWLAPKYNYIPIKIVGIQNGKITAEAMINSYKIID